MDKFEFYIDFEAITLDYMRKIIKKKWLTNSNIDDNQLKKLKSEDFIFCYTIGYFKETNFSKFTKKTTFIKFKSFGNNRDNELSVKILNDLRFLTGIKDFIPNENNSVFYSWGGLLEDKVLMKIFNLKTDNLTNRQISIDKLIPQNLFEKKYISNWDLLIKSYPNNPILNLNIRKKTTREADSTGEKMCVLGSVFLLDKWNDDTLYKIKEKDIKILMNDIKIYNSDDVCKLALIHKYWEVSNEIINLIKKIENERNSIISAKSQNIWLLRGIEKYLHDLKLTPTECSKLITLENNEIESSENIEKIKVINKLTKKFGNIKLFEILDLLNIEINKLQNEIEKYNSKILLVASQTYKKNKITPKL
ncbi:hypothetical protein RRG54_02160 [Mycoplasmopsis felis]|uniref:hypothetical protein n=1 Tax=Mycoplasmopsis felis TaxID=33923 RepID=UPI002AFF1417|nr:hypothetical protein [Mycoplasmopsis felis]WQQ11890.1 hypothetical protein RRG50_01385 [Mycoplasmopsis felis]